MNQSEVRFIVERRCQSESKHGVLLGIVPVSSKNPAENVQKLILETAQCKDCTFHSRFYLGSYNDELDINSIEKLAPTKFTILLKWIMLVLTFLIFFLTLHNLFYFGFTHALTVLSISMLFFFTCTIIDIWKSESLSKWKKSIVLINLLLFFYSILMLPTKEAIEMLNDSGVKKIVLDL